MALQLVDVPFEIVPKEMENKFMLNVINNYMEVTHLKGLNIVSEVNVGDEMLHQLNEIHSLQIYEDSHYFETLKGEDEQLFMESTLNNYNGFMHDIILTMERFKMCYRLEHNGKLFNMPNIQVW